MNVQINEWISPINQHSCFVLLDLKLSMSPMRHHVSIQFAWPLTIKPIFPLRVWNIHTLPLSRALTTLQVLASFFPNVWNIHPRCLDLWLHENSFELPPFSNSFPSHTTHFTVVVAYSTERNVGLLINETKETLKLEFKDREQMSSGTETNNAYRYKHVPVRTR